MHVTDKGSGLAHLVIDYGPEHDLVWVVSLDDGGDIWCVRNPLVRMPWNETLGRVKP